LGKFAFSDNLHLINICRIKHEQIANDRFGCRSGSRFPSQSVQASDASRIGKGDKMDKLVESEIKKYRVEIPDQFKTLLSKPFLLQGEDAKLYDGLRAALIEDRRPQSFDDWMEIHDHLTLLWEEHRLRRLSTGLMDGELHRAIKHYLVHTAGGELPELKEAFDLYCDYLLGTQATRKKVLNELKSRGISLDALYAKSAQLSSDTLQFFNSMMTDRAKRRRKLSKKKLQ
jgi:hypothetical protein